jgi:hypothetical protein
MRIVFENFQVADLVMTMKYEKYLLQRNLHNKIDDFWDHFETWQIIVRQMKKCTCNVQFQISLNQ